MGFLWTSFYVGELRFPDESAIEVTANQERLAFPTMYTRDGSDPEVTRWIEPRLFCELVRKANAGECAG